MLVSEVGLSLDPLNAGIAAGGVIAGAAGVVWAHWRSGAILSVRVEKSLESIDGPLDEESGQYGPSSSPSDLWRSEMGPVEARREWPTLTAPPEAGMCFALAEITVKNLGRASIQLEEVGVWFSPDHMATASDDDAFQMHPPWPSSPRLPLMLEGQTSRTWYVPAGIVKRYAEGLPNDPQWFRGYAKAAIAERPVTSQPGLIDDLNIV